MILRTALLLLLMSTLAACNKNGFKALKAGSQDSSSIGTPNPRVSLTNEYGVADMNGNIQAFQDLQFRFKVPGASGGSAISAENLPSWLSINNASGEIAGVPPAPETTNEFSLSVNGIASGPYRVAVLGDPIKQHQWHLKNTGQTAFAASGGIAGHDIHLEETIRSRTLGQGIKVAVSDTGILESHLSLKDNVIPGRNYLNNFAQVLNWNGSSTPDIAAPQLSHGTGVAGLIAETGWLGTGGRGVAPMAKIAGFLFVQAQEQLAIAGLFTAGHVDQYQGDFDVFNYSWGDVQCALIEYDQALRDRWRLTVQNGRGGKGSVMVKAAGNEYIGPLTDCYPNAPATSAYLGNANFTEDTSSSYLITVGALSADGISSSYSTPGASLWISAPGGEYGWNASPTNQAVHLEPAIVTTDFVGATRGNKTFAAIRNLFNAGAAPNASFTHTATFNGTSSAAPIVTGAVALILSANPNLTWRDVRHIMAVTADQIDAVQGPINHPQASANLTGHVYEQNWITNAAGFKFHNWYGFGRVNVDRAVAMARSYTSALGTFKETNTGATWKYDSGNLNNLAVPPATPAGVSNVLTVSENYKVETIEIRLSATQCVGALGVELTSPSGTKSILMNINSGLLDTEIDSHIFVSNAFYGENSAGNWTLKLIGGRPDCTTQWRNWQLNVLGH